MKLDVMYGRLMETAIIVSETFQNLLRSNKIDEDIMFGESESDTYATLREIAERIEDSNNDELYIEDIRELAEKEILKEYGPQERTYNIRFRETYEAVYPIEAPSEERAYELLKENYEKGIIDSPYIRGNCVDSSYSIDSEIYKEIKRRGDANESN